MCLIANGIVVKGVVLVLKVLSLWGEGSGLFQTVVYFWGLAVPPHRAPAAPRQLCCLSQESTLMSSIWGTASFPRWDSEDEGFAGGHRV